MTPRTRPPRLAVRPWKRPRSHQPCDARSPCRNAAWTQAGQPASEKPERSLDPSRPARIGEGGHRAIYATATGPATTTRAPRRLGLVLAVIATARLMVDVTVVTGFLKTEGLT